MTVRGTETARCSRKWPATRLMWALGFDTDPVFPVIVDCQDCPADPWTGEGPRQTRRFDAEYQPHYVGTAITSTKDRIKAGRSASSRRRSTASLRGRCASVSGSTSMH